MGKETEDRFVIVPFKKGYQAIFDIETSTWSLQWYSDLCVWKTLASGTVGSDDPELAAVKKKIVSPVPDQALKLSIGIQRARASLP